MDAAGLSLGLAVTAFGLGLRHGIDWDHIAAITDLSSSTERPRRALFLSTLYALGHAAVVIVLGVAAIVFGRSIPPSVDSWMGRMVGATLIVLGGWVLVGLIRHGRSFRLRSRWMLVYRGLFSGLRRVERWRGQRSVGLTHDHLHDHAGSDRHDHSHLPIEVGAEARLPAAVGSRGGTTGADARPHRPGHRHRHRHRMLLGDDPLASYGPTGAAGVGLIHGVGLETPTQIALFAAASSAATTAASISLLVAWVTGLVAANTVIALLAASGTLSATRSWWLYLTVSVIIAATSLVIGTMLIFGLDGALPALS